MNWADSLLDSQRRLEGIVASAMDAIITIDADQKVVLFNPAAEQMFKCPAEEALGQPIERFIPERYRAEHSAHIRRFGEAGATNRKMGSLGSISGLRTTGEEFPIEASISKVEVGSERLFTVILRDVTERKASEHALQESRQRMEGIVASAMDAIITVDEGQKIVLFNPAAERMFGCSAAEVLGSSIGRFIPNQHRAGHDAHIRRFRDTGVTSRRMGALGAISGLRASGEEFPIEASISQVIVGGERLSTVILRDITERKTNEEARALLAREVDHRAKNALAIAQAMVSLTRADSVEGFVAAVTGRISALSRAHSLLAQSEWRGASLAQTIGDELAPYAKQHEVRIEGPAVSLTADAVQPLSLMFHELATNAVKYGALSRPGGLVEIGWAARSGGLELWWNETGGPVIEAPKAKGFGSKLLQQVAVSQLGAKLGMDWREEGLQVRVLLPRNVFRHGKGDAELAPEEEANAPLSEGADRPGARILVVEDEPLIAMALSSELAELGWMVVGPASTIQEAEALLSDPAGLAAAILDVNLHGRPVYPLAEILKDLGVPFVFCTGYEMVDPAGRFADAPVIRKPASPSVLSATLAELLESRKIRARRGLARGARRRTKPS